MLDVILVPDLRAQAASSHCSHKAVCSNARTTCLQDLSGWSPTVRRTSKHHIQLVERLIMGCTACLSMLHVTARLASAWRIWCTDLVECRDIVQSHSSTAHSILAGGRHDCCHHTTSTGRTSLAGLYVTARDFAEARQLCCV